MKDGQWTFRYTGTYVTWLHRRLILCRRLDFPEFVTRNPSNMLTRDKLLARGWSTTLSSALSSLTWSDKLKLLRYLHNQIIFNIIINTILCRPGLRMSHYNSTPCHMKKHRYITLFPLRHTDFWQKKLGGSIALLKAQTTTTFEFCAREAAQVRILFIILSTDVLNMVLLDIWWLSIHKRGARREGGKAVPWSAWICHSWWVWGDSVGLGNQTSCETSKVIVLLTKLENKWEICLCYKLNNCK